MHSIFWYIDKTWFLILKYYFRYVSCLVMNIYIFSGIIGIFGQDSINLKWYRWRIINENFKWYWKYLIASGMTFMSGLVKEILKFYYRKAFYASRRQFYFVSSRIKLKEKLFEVKACLMCFRSGFWITVRIQLLDFIINQLFPSII